MYSHLNLPLYVKFKPVESLKMERPAFCGAQEGGFERVSECKGLFLAAESLLRLLKTERCLSLAEVLAVDFLFYQSMVY